MTGSCWLWPSLGTHELTYALLQACPVSLPASGMAPQGCTLQLSMQPTPIQTCYLADTLCFQQQAVCACRISCPQQALYRCVASAPCLAVLVCRFHLGFLGMSLLARCTSTELLCRPCQWSVGCWALHLPFPLRACSSRTCSILKSTALCCTTFCSCSRTAQSLPLPCLACTTVQSRVASESACRSCLGHAMPCHSASAFSISAALPAHSDPTPCLAGRETDPEWDKEIGEDVKQECSKFGAVLHHYVDRNSQVGPNSC